MLCFDTNIVIALINGRSEPAREHLRTVMTGGEAIALPVVVLFELQYGVAKSDQQRTSTAKLADFLTLVREVWAFDVDDAEEAALVRAGLAKRGTPIGPYDILIAAQARRRGAVLVTANTREFERVPGLRLENWLAP